MLLWLLLLRDLPEKEKQENSAGEKVHGDLAQAIRLALLQPTLIHITNACTTLPGRAWHSGPVGISLNRVPQGPPGAPRLVT